MALPNGGPVIRARTVIRKPESERWSPIAISEIKAIPRTPNPKDKAQQKVESESMTIGISPEGESGINVKVPEVSDQPTVYRDFKITRQVLERYGYSDECKGCEAAVMGYLPRPHNQGCRKRLEAEMTKDDTHRERLKKRDERLMKDPTGEPETAQVSSREQKTTEEEEPNTNAGEHTADEQAGSDADEDEESPEGGNKRAAPGECNRDHTGTGDSSGGNSGAPALDEQTRLAQQEEEARKYRRAEASHLAGHAKDGGQCVIKLRN